MSLFNETPKSLKLYFLLFGIIAALTDIGMFSDWHKYAIAKQLILSADIFVSIGYIYAGSNIEMLLLSKSNTPRLILFANLGLNIVTLIFVPTLIGRVVISAMMTFYLLANIKRLSMAY